MIYIIFLTQIIILILLAYLFINNLIKANSKVPEEYNVRSENAKLLIKELENLALDLSGDVEKKIEILKNLIKSADERIDMLNNLMQKQVAYVKIADVEDVAEENLPDIEKEEMYSNYKYGKIYEMADQGWDIIDIAKESKVGKGEVQLILDLRKDVK